MAKISNQFVYGRNLNWRGLLFDVFLVVIVMVLFISTSSTTMARTFNVVAFNAVGDGVTDDSKAFLAAWNAACSDESDSSRVLVPPNKKFLLFPVVFTGPCRPNVIAFEIRGSLIAPAYGSPAWRYSGGELITKIWLSFGKVNGLFVNGHGRQGLIDAKGQPWWSAGGDRSNRPTALHFNACNNLRVQALRHKDSAKNHISVNGCQDAILTGLQINAPADSPNTDGIDISESINVHVVKSEIATGDDCIAINGGCSYIYMRKIACGPGHGISIGSLGRDGTRGEVEEVHVDHCNFKKTTNGLRIKTWEGASGFVRKVFYNDVTFDRVQNPIFIDQFYCDPCPDQAIEINGVTYTGIRGTTLTSTAINLNCSAACTNLLFQDVNLRPASSSLSLSAACRNAHGHAHNTNPPVDCLVA